MVDRDDIPGLDLKHVWHPYTQAGMAPAPVEIVSGRGAKLTAADGREFLDLISSWWVNIHGHAHPAIAAAIADQARRLEQVVFAGFTHAPAVRLAERLAGLLPRELNRVFYSDDGSTAVEVALKIAWQYWRNLGEKGRTRFLAFCGGYHGDTLGAMSAGASFGFYAPFSDLLLPMEFLTYPGTWDGDNTVEERERESLAALDALLDSRSGELAAAIIEPLVQGAGGMRMCRPEFLRALAKRLREAGVLLIFDEVMTGFGRTGAMFACGKAGVAPDLICLSKGLTGGFLPLAATVCREEIFEAFLDDGFAKAFAHGHSYSANPLGCAAALASLDLFESEGTLSRVAAVEAVHRERLLDLGELPLALRTRVTGSIAAFDLETDDKGYGSAAGERLKMRLMDRGLLLRPLGDVVYLMPPYCIGLDELERAYDVIRQVLEEG